MIIRYSLKQLLVGISLLILITSCSTTKYSSIKKEITKKESLKQDSSYTKITKDTIITPNSISITKSIKLDSNFNTIEFQDSTNQLITIISKQDGVLTFKTLIKPKPIIVSKVFEQIKIKKDIRDTITNKTLISKKETKIEYKTSYKGLKISILVIGLLILSYYTYKFFIRKV